MPNFRPPCQVIFENFSQPQLISFTQKISKHVPSDVFNTLKQDDQEASSDVQAVGNKAEEVFEDAQTSDDSEDDEVYTAEDDLKEGRLQIVPTDRAVLEDSYWYQPGLPRYVLFCLL